MSAAGAALEAAPETFQRGVWVYVFFSNIFFACVSFSIILPSLWPYLSRSDTTLNRTPKAPCNATHPERFPLLTVRSLALPDVYP